MSQDYLDLDFDFEEIKDDAAEAGSREILFATPNKNNERVLKVRFLSNFVKFGVKWVDGVGNVPGAKGETRTLSDGTVKPLKSLWVAEVLNLDTKKKQLIEMDWGVYQSFPSIDKELKMSADCTIHIPKAGEGKNATVTMSNPRPLTPEEEAITKETIRSIKEVYAEKVQKAKGMTTAQPTAAQAEVVDIVDF